MNKLWMQIINDAKTQCLNDMWKGSPLRVFRTQYGEVGYFVVQFQAPNGDLVGYREETGKPEVLCKYSKWYVPATSRACRAFLARDEYFRSNQWKYVDRWKSYGG